MIRAAGRPRRALAMLAGVGLVAATGACGSATSTPAGGEAPSDLSVTLAPNGAYTVSWAVSGQSTVTLYAATSPRDPSEFGKAVAETSQTTVTVSQLDPNRRWYFEAVTESGESTVAASRRVRLEGTSNTRDLGGYRTADGRMVRWGAVYRSDALTELTDADLAMLTSLGLSAVIDFRTDEEVAADGKDRLPPGVEWVHRPALNPALGKLAETLTTAIHSGNPALVQQTLGDGKAVQMVTDAYTNLITSEKAQAAFADTLRRIAHSGDAAVLFHCTAGKDRAGQMTAILLGLLGVPQKTIMQDYLLSNRYLQQENKRTLQALQQRGINPDLLRPLLGVKKTYLQATLNTIHTKYGSMAAYAKQALGLDAATIHELRDSLLISPDNGAE